MRFYGLLMKRVLFAVFALVVSPLLIASTGVLRVESSTPDVTIEVNGQVLRTSTGRPVVVELPTGQHTVKASKEDFTPESQDVVIQADRVTSITFNLSAAAPFQIRKPSEAVLQRGYGDLTIMTDLPGAEIYMNGRKVPDITPLTLEHMAEGKWSVGLVLNGRRINRDVQIEPNKVTTLRVFFDPTQEQAYLAEQARLRKVQQEQVEAQRVAEMRAREAARFAAGVREAKALLAKQASRLAAAKASRTWEESMQFYPKDYREEEGSKEVARLSKTLTLDSGVNHQLDVVVMRDTYRSPSVDRKSLRSGDMITNTSSWANTVIFYLDNMELRRITNKMAQKANWQVTWSGGSKPMGVEDIPEIREFEPGQLSLSGVVLNYEFIWFNNLSPKAIIIRATPVDN